VCRLSTTKRSLNMNVEILILKHYVITWNENRNFKNFQVMLMLSINAKVMLPLFKKTLFSISIDILKLLPQDFLFEPDRLSFNWYVLVKYLIQRLANLIIKFQCLLIWKYYLILTCDFVFTHELIIEYG